MGTVAQMSYDSDCDLRLNAPSALQHQSAAAQKARRAKWAARAGTSAVVRSGLVWRRPRYCVEAISVSIAAAEQFRAAHELIDKALYGIRHGPPIIDIQRKVS